MTLSLVLPDSLIGGRFVSNEEPSRSTREAVMLAATDNTNAFAFGVTTFCRMLCCSVDVIPFYASKNLGVDDNCAVARHTPRSALEMADSAGAYPKASELRTYTGRRSAGLVGRL